MNQQQKPLGIEKLVSELRVRNRGNYTYLKYVSTHKEGDIIVLTDLPMRQANFPEGYYWKKGMITNKKPEGIYEEYPVCKLCK